MEKISRIVPTSPRVQAVDMARERPVRKSAPGFGAPESQSTNRGPKKHAVVEAPRVYNETYGPDAKMQREAEAVKKLSDQFFLNQAKIPQAPANDFTEEAPIELIGDAPVQEAPEKWVEIPNIIDNTEESAPTPSSLSKRV